MDKLTLLNSMQTGHHNFTAFISELTRQQMLQPGVIGEWSVKDILAHIVVHEQRMIDWIGKKLNGESLDGPQPYSMPDEALNRLNEQIYRQNRDRPLDDVLADLESVHLQALAMVDSAPGADLFDARRFSLQDGEPLCEAVAANTFSHYEEHSRDIRAWLSN